MASKHKKNEFHVGMFSFFTGAGFLDLGFEDAGFKSYLANEIDPNFAAVYRYSHEQMRKSLPVYGLQEGDVCAYLDDEARAKELAKMIRHARRDVSLVGFIGGPPCPDFSVANANAQGENGKRGVLTRVYVDLICEQHPDFFVLENVKGLINTAKHRVFFCRMVEQLQMNGYSTSYRLVNALEYGAAQDRQRVILVGVKTSLCKGNEENGQIDGFPWEKFIRYSMARIAKVKWPTTDKFIEDAERRIPDGIIKPLTVQFWFDQNDVTHHSGIPVNLDRVLGASYNTRSVLESLLAHTPEIYTCLPGRIESIQGHETIERGHKHIILSDEPHALGEVQSMNLGEDCVISEIPSVGMMYDVVPPVRPNDTIDIEIRRRHSQMQIALAEIAKSLDMRTWLAVEDHGIRYAGRVITEYPFIVHDLFRERVISSYPEAINVGKHIDCMYFNGGLPFAFEVEHSTGVTSGLTRMLSFKNQGPNLSTHYVIVAPDDDRNLVMQRAQPEQFEELHPLYFPYSQIEELYSFVKRHAEKHGGKLRGVKKEDFLLNFMEECRAA